MMEVVVGLERDLRELQGQGHIASVWRSGSVTTVLCDVGPRVSYLMWVVVLVLVV